MNIVEIKTFKFDELSPEAQQVAINQYRESDNLYEGWYEHLEEDFHAILEMIGLYNIDSQFSGFCSQGDGASFIGNYQYKKGCLKAIKRHAPKDSELHNIVKGIIYHQKDNGYLLSCEIYHSGNYSHSNTMRFDWEKAGDSYFEWKNCHIEDELEQLFKDLADWYYSRLKNEYEFLNSDECIKENIISNEYDFLENGKQYY